MSASEEIGTAPGLAITRLADGAVVLDFMGGPYIRLSRERWDALAQAMRQAGRRPRETGTGWPPSPG